MFWTIVREVRTQQPIRQRVSPSRRMARGPYSVASARAWRG